MQNEQDFPTIRAEQEEVAPMGRAASAEREITPTRATAEELPAFVPAGPAEAETVIIGGPPPSLAWLVVTGGPRTGRLFRLDPRGTVVGRDSRSDVILDDGAVSRLHAKLRIEKGDDGEERWFIQDLASENGTAVNGEQIVKQALADGDEIVMGQTTFAFKMI